MGWEKVACWGTKAAISVKCVEIEEMLLWRAYRKSPTLFRMVPSATRYDLRESQKLSGHSYVWRIARSSLRQHSCLVPIFSWSAYITDASSTVHVYPVQVVGLGSRTDAVTAVDGCRTSTRYLRARWPVYRRPRVLPLTTSPAAAADSTASC